MVTIKPFQNEEEVIEIGELTVENRLDRIELYGSLQITLDKQGLQHARALKALLDKTVKAMQASDLPDRISVSAPDQVDNPFGS
jgi:hypothetical protein